jgi:hypothetical protein
MQTFIRKFSHGILFLILFFINAAVFALPFTIVPAPGTTLPTLVNPGESVAAFYAITNNSVQNLNGNFIKYLPPNVTQVTADGAVPNLCGSTFNLTPTGSSNQTCILELSVSDAVDANDPDPHHHLFACLFGGVLCAGTNYPLNVNGAGNLIGITLTPANASVAIGHSIQYIATAVFADGSTEDVTALTTWSSSNTAVATISSSGLATGVTASTALITGTFSGSSATTLLNVVPFAEVTGSYIGTGGASFPIVIQSINQGSTWNYSVTSTTASVLPAGNTGGFNVVGADCSGLHCLNVGNYTAAGNPQIYGFQSQDAGNSWNTCISALTPLPALYVSGNLLASSCSGATCIAAGSYTDTAPGNIDPLIIRTINSGTNYTVAVDSTSAAIPGDSNGDVALLTATCNSSLCLSAGDYATTNVIVQSPILLQSVGGGAWTAAIASATPTPPTDFSGTGILAASACTPTTRCVAAGSYFSSSAPTITEAPYGAETTNTGAAWNYVITSADIPADYSGPGGGETLTAAACGSNLCIMAGTYDSTSEGGLTPVVYQSTIGGPGNWTIAVSALVGPIVPTNIGTTVKSASCSLNLCVIDGTYNPGSGNQSPFLLVTTNNGASWNYATLPASPSDAVSFTMGSVNCQGTYCVVAAAYTNGSAASQPVVLQSINGGATWTYTVTSSSPAKPADATQITFTSAALSHISLKAQLQTTTQKNFNHAELLNNLLHRQNNK